MSYKTNKALGIPEKNETTKTNTFPARQSLVLVLTQTCVQQVFVEAVQIRFWQRGVLSVCLILRFLRVI